jgi:serine/threonine-protein kinase
MKTKTPAPGPERRRDPRVDIAVPLQLRLPDLDSVFSGQAVNVSRSGMFIPMDKPPAVGTRLHIDLSTQEEKLLDATIEVVRRVDDIRGSGIGVRFVDISYGARALIDRMVADENLFGDFHLEALLGQGAMGEVYRARDLSSDEAGRVVALKRILPELTAIEHIANLFRREAGIARQLDHDHIVRVFDVGEVERTFYIAMEYVDGCHLGQLVTLCAARGIQLPVDLVCYIGHCVANALHYAHGLCTPQGEPLGLVHRDVSPSNVFLSDLGDIKLGDFGVAMVRHGQDEEPKARVGKELYAAPEQLLGSSVPASDVYGLGATLFEVLTHHSAFEDDPDAKLQRLPPSATELRPDVPEEVAAVLLRAMSPVPPGDELPADLATRFEGVEPRYDDAAAFASALEEVFNPAIGNNLAVSAVLRGVCGA